MQKALMAFRRNAGLLCETSAARKTCLSYCGYEPEPGPSSAQWWMTATGTRLEITKVLNRTMPLGRQNMHPISKLFPNLCKVIGIDRHCNKKLGRLNTACPNPRNAAAV